MTLRENARGRLVFLAAAAVLLLVPPAVLSTQYGLPLLGRYLCYAIAAVGIGLAWGRGGMLVLGQGVFFGLGGYAMAMHLKLAEAGPSGLPDFMELYGDADTTLPWWWAPFRHVWFTIPATVLLPMAVAWGLGLLIFRNRVRGAYFAILSQALAAAMVILLVGQQQTTAGTNGLSNIRVFFGYDLTDPANVRTVYVLAAAGLLGAYLLVRQVSQSRMGQLLVATRDAEDRVRFLGYDPTRVKLVAYVLAAGVAGLGGALFVPIVGAISPANIGVVPSIELVIAVALGGRLTLLGPAAGAVLLYYSRTELSTQWPDAWNYVMGGLFIVIVGFLPSGLAGLGQAVRARPLPVRRRAPDPRPGEAPAPEALGATP